MNAKKLLGFIFLFIICNCAISSTINSNGTGGGNWSVTTTWSLSVVPTASVDVIIMSGDNVTVDASTANLNSITINTGGTLTLNSNGKIVTVTSSGTKLITVNGTLTLSNVVATASQINCGNLTIANGGVMNNNSVAASAPTLTVAATFSVASGGTLNHNAVGSGTAGSTKDLFGNAATMTLGATSNINITNWGVASQGPPSLPTATYGNLTFSVSTAWNGSLAQGTTTTFSVQNNFSVGATGGFEFRMGSASQTYTINVGGNLTVSSGTLSLTGSGSTSGGTITANVAGNVIVSGGVLDLNSNQKATAVNLNVTGSINESGTGIIQQSKASNGAINLTGNLTLAGTSSLNVTTNANLNLIGSANQTITGNNNTLSINNLNDTLKSTGTVTLASNTPITLNNSLFLINTGGANQFSDGGNTITGANNFNLGGNAAGYNLTGTILCTAASGTQKFQYANGGPNTGLAIPASLNNVTITNTGTGKVSFLSTTTASTVTIKGNLTVSTGTIVTLMSTAASSGNHTFNIGGNYTNSTTVSPAKNTTIIFNGSSTQTITSSATGGEIFPNITISNPTTVSLASALSVTTNTSMTTSGNLSITSGTLDCKSNQITGNATGTFSMSAGTSLLLGSTTSATAVLFPTNFIGGNITLNNTSTVTYQSNGAQTVSSTPTTYGNLIVGTGAASTTKTLAGAITVNGNLTINASTTLDVSASNFAIGLLGNWTNNGTLTAQNGIITFNGTAAQSIGGTSNTSFYNLTLSNSAANITLANAETVNNNLAISAGTLDCSTNQITGNASGNLTMNSGASLLLGSIASATSVLFPTNFTTLHTTLNAGSTVTYQVGGAQTISNIPTYGNFIVSGSGTKTLVGATTIKGNATITSGTLDCSTFQLAGLAGKSFTMNANTNLVLGSTASAISISFPTNYLVAGISLDDASTVTYQSNANQTISATPATYGNLILSSGAASTTKTPANILTVDGTLTINANATLDVTSTNNYGIFLNGSWVNNGTFNAQAGTVTLSGTTNQNIGGSSTTNFYNLTSNNSAGVKLSSAQSLSGSLLLNAGVFNTNSQTFTLLTTVNGSTYTTGNIGVIDPSANITGNITVQQYAARGGYTGWALLGTPISSALTFADWNDNFSITCSTCPDGCCPGGSPFTSIYYYDETQPGTYGDAAKYIPIVNVTDAITPAKGYWVYLGTGTTNTSAIIFDVSGTVAQAQTTPVNVLLTYTNHGSTSDDGWNLISNPLPSPISWTSLMGSTANIDNAIYVYNQSLNGGVGAYSQYVAGVSNPAVGSGGIGDNIPMCQAFYVHSTGATALTALESNKVNANPDFLRMNSNTVTSYQSVARLFLDNGVQHDETDFHFNPSATIHFEKEYDAYKILNDPTQPYIAGVSDAQMLSISGLPQAQNVSSPVTAMVTTSGTFTITLGGNPPVGVCITLFDSYTGTTTNLVTSNYVCTLYDTTTVSRFTINFGTSALAATTNVLQPVCTNPTAGLITAVGNNAGPWNYTWRDGTGNIIRTSPNKTTADSLKQLSNGNYVVEINTVGQCDNFTGNFSINQAIVPVAQFSSNATTVNAYVDTVLFFNASSNSTSWQWTFGDGNTSIAQNPWDVYNAPGIYTVTLVVYNNSCNDTSTQIITVLGSTAVSSSLSSNEINIYRSETGAMVSFNLKVQSTAVLNLYDVTGNQISSQNVAAYKNQENIILPEAHGIYMVQVITNGKSIVKKIIW